MDEVQNLRNSTTALQWGRDLSVAEWRWGFGGDGMAEMLQWGRDLSVAECTARARHAIRASSFNGAATFRSRNVPDLFQYVHPHAVLQWGRDFSVAE